MSAATKAGRAAAAAPTAFTMTRVINAPRDLVWAAHSSAEHLRHWWGPKGCKLTVNSLEFRPGGLFHYTMGYSTGADMGGRFFYRDMAAPGHLVYLSSFANAQGGIARAPFSELCPLELLNTLTFSETDGKTTLSLHVVPFGATPEEIAFFDQLRASGLEQGFGGTYDQLDAHLASLGDGKTT
jgi:uncharacterized protein YndB with AHSA1/START domain